MAYDRQGTAAKKLAVLGSILGATGGRQPYTVWRTLQGRYPELAGSVTASAGIKAKGATKRGDFLRVGGTTAFRSHDRAALQQLLAVAAEAGTRVGFEATFFDNEAGGYRTKHVDGVPYGHGKRKSDPSSPAPAPDRKQRKPRGPVTIYTPVDPGLDPGLLAFGDDGSMRTPTDFWDQLAATWAAGEDVP